jgi:hypothetical protein
VPMDDAASMASALTSVLDDHELAGRLGTAARDVPRRFSEQVMVERTLELLGTVAARGRRA